MFKKTNKVHPETGISQAARPPESKVLHIKSPSRTKPEAQGESSPTKSAGSKAVHIKKPFLIQPETQSDFPAAGSPDSKTVHTKMPCMIRPETQGESSPTRSASSKTAQIGRPFLIQPEAHGESSAAGSSLRQTAAASNLAPKAQATSHVKECLKGTKLQFDDFDLGATVGMGSFGRVRVVKMKGSSDRAPMALKIMIKSEVIKLKQVEHVKDEKEIMLSVHHTFIVNLLTVFQDDKRLCMLLEYVNGGELFSHLRKEGRLQNEHAMFYAGEIVLAFEYLQSLHIAYRDLKPENLLIDSGGHLKITDFGFAKVVEDRTFTLCGTPEYLAPEIIQSKGHGTPVDWWALGILMFEMLAGYPPFYDDSPFELYTKILARKIVFPRHFDKDGQDLIKRLLTLDVTKRFGCQKDGAADIKKHKWYQGFNWVALGNRAMATPMVPPVKSADDTSMFDSYPESTEASAPSISEADQANFKCFNMN